MELVKELEELLQELDLRIAQTPAEPRRGELALVRDEVYDELRKARIVFA